MSYILFLADSGSGGHGDVHTLLDPHGFGLVFWTAVTFVIVLVALHRVAWGPLMSALDQREVAIAGQVDASRRVREEADAVKAKYEALMEGHRREGQRIIDEGEADKKRILEDAHAKATADAQDVKARAQRDIQQAKLKALAEVKAESVTLAMAIAEKVIGAEVDAKRHHVLVDEVLARIEDKARAEKGTHGG